MDKDAKYVALAKAIAEKESKNNFYAVGDNGTSFGVGQWNNLGKPLGKGELPAVWKEHASIVLGDPNSPMTEQNQKAVLTGMVKKWADEGLQPYQIAAKWNSGSEKGWENKVGTTVVNGKSLSYNTPKYVQEVDSIYKRNVQNIAVSPVDEQQVEAPVDTVAVERTQRVSEGLPVAVNDKRATPTMGGEIVRGLIKAPIMSALTLARGVATPFSKKVRDEGITIKSGYLGNVTDAQTGIENVADKASQDFLTGNQSLGKSLGKVVGRAGTTTLDVAGLLPIEGVASGVGKQALPQVLKQAGKLGGAFGSAYGLSGSLEQGNNFTDTIVNTLTGGLTGAGLGVGLAGVGEGIAKGASKYAQSKVNKIITRRNKALDAVEGNNQTLQKVTQKAKKMGIDVRKITSETDLLANAVDENGRLTTIGDGNVVDTYTKEFIEPNEKLVGDILKKEGVSISPDVVEKYLTKKVRDSGIQGEKLTTALNKVSKEVDGYRIFADPETGLIPVELIHKAKIDKYSDINFLTEASVKKYDKTIAQGLKELVENNSTAEIKAINDDLAKHFSMIDYLRKLDGRKVEGGRLGKYFAKTIGAVVGSNFGPLGSIVGAELAGELKSNQLQKTLSGKTGKVVEVGKNIIKGKEFLNKKPLQLKGTQSSNNLGNRQYNQAATMSNTINDGISNIIQSKESKVKGLINTLRDDIKNNGQRGSVEVFKNVDDNLIQEARKYKSAEEFVKAKTNALHGSDTEITQFDTKFLGKNTESKGSKNTFFFTSSKEMADEYGRAAFLKKKVSELGDIKPEQRSRLLAEAKGKAKLNGVSLEYKNPKIIKLRGVLKDNLVAKDIQKAKEQGYDAIVYKDVIDPVLGDSEKFIRGDVTAVFDPSKIKTKSQLTDIWNKAQSTQGKAPVEAFGNVQLGLLPKVAGVTALGVLGANLYNRKEKSKSLKESK